MRRRPVGVIPLPRLIRSSTRVNPASSGSWKRWCSDGRPRSPSTTRTSRPACATPGRAARQRGRRRPLPRRRSRRPCGCLPATTRRRGGRARRCPRRRDGPGRSSSATTGVPAICPSWPAEVTRRRSVSRATTASAMPIATTTNAMNPLRIGRGAAASLGGTAALSSRRSSPANAARTCRSARRSSSSPTPPALPRSSAARSPHGWRSAVPRGSARSPRVARREMSPRPRWRSAPRAPARRRFR